MSKILVTGSDGRFGKILQKIDKKLIFKNKKQLNILSVKSISKTGVDRVSVGSITHSATGIDLKLEI